MSTAVIIGAGIGGLATAIRLQLKGYQSEVYEVNAYPGGKLTEFQVGGYRFDAGPSLFTLPEQVDALFHAAGKDPRAYYTYQRLDPITRYFYPDGTHINAWAEPETFAKEIEQKTGVAKEKVLKLLKKSEGLYDLTKHVFLERSLHRLDTYLQRDTMHSMLRLHKLDAFRSMHQANAALFGDARIVQLFNRYATYNGSDPYQAPATLNIIPHLECNMGAYFPHGGMHQLTQSLYQLGLDLGVTYHFEEPVKRIVVEQGIAQGIEVTGKWIPADIVVSNADIVPTYRHLLPEQKAPEQTLKQSRSSSALIFYWGIKANFPDLDVHNIFFSKDYEAEFDHIWKRHTVYEDPTIYVNISAKRAPQDAPPGCENWFTMINVPHDQEQDWDTLIPWLRERMLQKLGDMLGREIAPLIEAEAVLEPRSIQAKTASHLGALYGNSSNNPFAAFLRHPNFSRQIKNLYFCGGSVHPGGGIPLCLLSAKITGELVPNPQASPQQV